MWNRGFQFSLLQGKPIEHSIVDYDTHEKDGSTLIPLLLIKIFNSLNFMKKKHTHTFITYKDEKSDN